MSELPPHTYKEQRTLERKASRSREEMLARGDLDLPTVCGFTYKPRPTKAQKAQRNWKPSDTVCHRAAGTGTTHHGRGFCDYHEWVVANETANATTPRNELTYAMKQAAERSKFFGDPRSIDPHTVLLEEIGRSAGIVGYYETKLQEFRDKYGMTDEDILTQRTLKDGEKPSVWMELFNTERDHLVKTCIAAIKAGVAERKVQIAEQQGRMIAAMMVAFMHDPEIGLTPDQMLKAPSVIRRHLLSLPAASPLGVDPAAVLANTNNRRTGEVIDI